MASIWRGVPAARPGPPDNFIYRLRSNRMLYRVSRGLKRTWAPAFFALLFVYLGVSLASHLLYNIQDVAGLTCTEERQCHGPRKGLWHARPDGESKTVEFNTSDLCKPTGILLERNARYHVEMKATSAWTRRRFSGPGIGGFSANESAGLVSSLAARARRAAAARSDAGLVPDRAALRRVGGEEVFLDPDPDDYKIQDNIRPTRNGELFIFVNDAVIGIPGLYDVFYRNNKGGGETDGHAEMMPAH